MPKKKPSLKQQTQFAKDRARYASAVLGGAEFMKREPRGYRGGEYTRVRWHYRIPPYGWSLAGYFTRREAVENAIIHLENMT